MRSTIIVAAFFGIAISPSFAQNTNSSTAPTVLAPTKLPEVLAPTKLPEPRNPAIKTTEGNNPGAPVTGANSFTEAQAKLRIEGRGYQNVSALEKDERGIWRGTALKDGKLVAVSVDYQGNVSCAACGLP